MDSWQESGKPEKPPLRWPLTQLIGTVLVVLAAGYKLHGQSCAMCYTTVAGGGKGVIYALQSGIIVLLVPPVLLFVGLTILLFRWRTSASRVPESATLGTQL
jgi:hypothetical protein